MRLLKKAVTLPIEGIPAERIYERIAARAIVLKGEDILLIYTRRYNDYSIPGGGVDQNEDVKDGLLRELAEETGAQNVKVIEPFGLYEEYRSTYYDGFDVMHMVSHFYICDADRVLGEAEPEDYEVKNGSVAKWVNIYEAIDFNRKVIQANENSMGLSIKRETFMLEKIAEELVKK